MLALYDFRPANFKDCLLPTETTTVIFEDPASDAYNV